MMHWLDRAMRALGRCATSLAKSADSKNQSAARRRLAFEALEPRWVLSHIAPGLVDAPQTYSGALDGKIVFTSGGHGWQWNSNLGRYATDRPEYQLVEDFGNQDQLTYYADYLLRAGATVVPMRPVGRQINEVVLDNDSPGVTFTGSWSNSTGSDYYDEDYGAVADAVSYRFASTTTGAENAVATYTPTIPQAGFYPVYTWVARGSHNTTTPSNRTTQLYRINHTGGSTEIRVDHRIVGHGWVYLGTYHFNSGSSSTLGSVQISNNSPVGGVAIADAIRFGNGIGDSTVSGGPSPSGYPREDENSWHWIARMIGQGTTLSEAIGSANNVSAPSNMAEWMYDPAGLNPDLPFGGAVYVGFHSNGTTGNPDTATARGAVGLIDSDAGDRTPHQADLALYLGRQINQDMQNLPGVFEYNWSNRTTHTFTSQFGEIDLGTDAEMDATIIEVAFHDNIQDGALLRDPKARDQMARSTYQGTLEYFDNWGGLNSPVSLPTAPNHVSAVSDVPGEVTVSWAPGPSTPSSVYGAAATGFRIYASVDGYGFDGGTFVAGGATTSHTLTGFDPDTPYYFKVVAENAGGRSHSSEVVTALPSGGPKQVLIVSGFDRFDRTQDFAYPYAFTGDGVVDRVWSRYNNSFDYVVQVHSAIHDSRPGIHVASTSNEEVISGAVNLTDYQTVIWILGEESTIDETLNATEQTKVEQFIAGGGNLFLSGSEIAWDLDRPSGPTSVDRSFYENTLKGNFVSDDAGTYTATADPGGIFAGMSNFVFSSGSAFSTLDGQLYNVDSPDVIAPQPGAAVALNYSNGSGAAAIQVQGTGGRGNLVMLAFPFEAITNETRRNNAMGRILDFFDLAAPGAEIAIQTRVNGEDANSPTGPILAPGSMATFTYLVTNPGTFALSNVVVLDDNGTPGNAADDFNPAFVGGDTNSNGLLDLTETWSYTATRTVVGGQQTHIGTASGLGNSQTVMASDPANYLGAVPGIEIKKFVNGDDADSPPGPSFTLGSLIIFSYSVSNTGNVPLGDVVVMDDNGTPENAADDFSPSFSSGDTNGNGQLDLGETWSYVAVRSAGFGQHASVATVSAEDIVGQAVDDSDPLHYFGIYYAIAINKYVNGEDADSPPGPSLDAGSTATFTYEVTNAGNVALADVIVMDDNGTPLDASDDFQPAYVSGDTNEDGVLDIDETWTYSATHLVTLGQHSSTAQAIGDPDGESVVDTDPVHFLGVASNNADFNASGTVDAADYVLWRKHNGTTSGATQAMGDANGDGMVDADDYDAWHAQFGTATAEAAVAEAFAESDAISDQTGTRDAAFAVFADDTRTPLRAPRPKTLLGNHGILLGARSDVSALIAELALSASKRDQPARDDVAPANSDDGEYPQTADSTGTLKVDLRPRLARRHPSHADR